MGIPLYYLSLDEAYGTQLCDSIHEKSFENSSQLRKWQTLKKVGGGVLHLKMKLTPFPLNTGWLNLNEHGSQAVAKQSS